MPKPRKCDECGQPFERRQLGQKVCSTACALLWASKHPEVIDKVAKASERARKQRMRKQKKEDKARLLELEPISYFLNRAQVQVNRYVVHVRDRFEGCISCGRTDATKWDAGHWRTRKAAAHLRFNLDNIFKQCSRPCNKDLSGNVLKMKEGMIARIGVDRVEAIANDNRIHKWTREEALEIETRFKELNKQIDKFE